VVLIASYVRPKDSLQIFELNCDQRNWTSLQWKTVHRQQLIQFTARMALPTIISAWLQKRTKPYTQGRVQTYQVMNNHFAQLHGD